MAVGKRLRSRDEHLMFIIPMLDVTNPRGDVRCSTVKQYWTCVLGLARRPNRGGPQRVGHLSPVQNRSPPSHHARAMAIALECLSVWFGSRGCILAVGSSRPLVSVMVVSGPLDCFSSRPLDSCNGSDLDGAPTLRAGIMADEGVQRKILVEDNIDWVTDDPRTTPSKFEFEENFPEDLFTDIEIPGHADWEVRIPVARQRICSTFKNGGFPMYQIAFEHMGLRLPLTDLEVAIFNHLELCPSQLHPNSLAFIRAFEIVAAHLQLAPTITLFFHLFGIQRSRPRGNVTDKCGWVSLKQQKKFFDIFEESLQGFKDKWFVVRPITSKGWKSIIVRGPKLDDEGKVVLGPDGKPIEVDCERFPFCWSTKHYAREAKSFTFKKGALSKEELADLNFGHRCARIFNVFNTCIFVIPPAMGHDCMLDGRTSMKISDADQTILASMGPESIRNVERDEGRDHAKGFGERLTIVEKDLSSETKALKDPQAKVTQLEKDLQNAKEEEGKLKERVGELEEKLSSLTLTPTADEEERKVDPTGTYANFSRAGLIAKIYEVGDLQLEVASSSFRNALAKLQILNPGVQLITEGMDEMKEVRDGQISSPPLDEEEA
ncbi:hypothetical protein TSUD_302110 [Trifolium subterraneum]|uniref:Transposase (putative) gypsy type domain-containing protein n=1 Tax=Trifolium subterraneum TaxID=3900 RepID=A0A2Z6PD84_TRISU|nr:hypothetical protein TSUD_302110 [Trifolium subterraneum]